KSDRNIIARTYVLENSKQRSNDELKHDDQDVRSQIDLDHVGLVPVAASTTFVSYARGTENFDGNNYDGPSKMSEYVVLFQKPNNQLVFRQYQLVEPAGVEDLQNGAKRYLTVSRERPASNEVAARQYLRDKSKEQQDKLEVPASLQERWEQQAAFFKNHIETQTKHLDTIIETEVPVQPKQGLGAKIALRLFPSLRK
ncbi:MAG: hypothetical protein DI551_04985, partial [Micavibrio aeruginosavorus]